MPCARRRAHTLRCPSPRKGEIASTCRICAVSTSSVYAVFGPRLAGSVGGLAALVMIERRPAYPPFLTDSHHAIAPLLGRRRGVAHRVDLPVAKGKPPRSRWTASLDSSSRIVKSPTKAFNRSSSSSQPSAARLFKPACPLATNWSRHSDTVAAVSPASRETRSRSSPRNRRHTTSIFLREENRPRSAFDFAMNTSLTEGQYAPIECPRKSWGGGKCS